MFTNIKLVIAGVIVLAFLSLFTAYKIKAGQLEAARAALITEQANNAALTSTVASQRQNRKEVQNSAAVQQTIEDQSAPIHQAIKDSTPETALNEKQKNIADCILALYRGVLKSGSCSGPAGGDILPKAGQAVPSATQDR